MSEMKLKPYIIGHEEQLGVEPPPDLRSVPPIPPALAYIINAEIQSDLNNNYIERHIDVVEGGDF